MPPKQFTTLMQMKNTVIDYFLFAGLPYNSLPPTACGRSPLAEGLRGERTFYGKPAGDSR